MCPSLLKDNTSGPRERSTNANGVHQFDFKFTAERPNNFLRQLFVIKAGHATGKEQCIVAPLHLQFAEFVKRAIGERRLRAATPSSRTRAWKTSCWRSSRGREMNPIFGRSSFYYWASLGTYLALMGRYLVTRDWSAFEIIPMFMPIWLAAATVSTPLI